jgi:recombination protein RecT
MQSTTVTKAPIKPIDAVRAQLYLPSMKEQLVMALPQHVTVEKFLRVAITAIQQTPSLLTADRNSLFAAIVTSAQLGLLPDAQLGEAYFVPFKGKVQLIPGYRGLLKLARQGDIGYVEVETIHQNDDVMWINGDESRFEARVNWRDRGPLDGFYALAKFRDGGIAARVVMTKEQVDQVRARSQAANGPAWTDNYEEMGKKTVLRRLSKLLPLSTTAASAFRVSELQEELHRPSQVINGEVISDEPEPVHEEVVLETKPKRRRSALDELIPESARPGTARQAAASGGDRPDLRVDPETGRILEDGEGVEEAQSDT